MKKILLWIVVLAMLIGVVQTPMAVQAETSETYVQFDDLEVLQENARSNNENPVGASNTDGPASWAFNGNSGNWWHSNWYTEQNNAGKPTEENPIYIQTGFNRRWYLKEILYTPRDTGNGGRCHIGKYEVKVANTLTDEPTDDDFDITVCTGEFTSDQDNGEQKRIVFEEEVVATHVRIIVTSHLGTNNYVAAKHINFVGRDYECAHENTEAIGETKNPTDTEDGEIAGVRCTDCGYEIQALQIIPAGRYRENNRLVFPTEEGSEYTVSFEAEHGQVIDGGSGWGARRTDKTEASGEMVVSGVDEADDQLIFYYTADQAGTYTATVTYYSGSENNKLVWAEENNMIESNLGVAVEDYETNLANVKHTMDITLEVKKAGDGKLVFYGSSGKAPTLDKFDITLTEAACTHFWVNGVCKLCRETETDAELPTKYVVNAYVAGVKNDEISETDLNSGSVVTITAPETDGTNPFSHWSYDNSGSSIVSTNKKYTLYVTKQMELYAIYKADPETAQSTIVISNKYTVLAGNNYVCFEATRDILEDYTVVEQGVLYGINGEVISAEDAISTEGIVNTGVKKVVGTSHANKGVTRLDIPVGNRVSEADRVYARGYVIVEKDGVKEVIRSTVDSDYFSNPALPRK